MLKGLFFSVPSVSVNYTLTPVIDELSAGDYRIIYYNSEGFQPLGDHPFQFRPYPPDFNGYYSDRIDENTSYFQFGEILINSAKGLLDFLLAEVEREKPDFILHSHLAVWGKLIANYHQLPSITLYTTFILDKRIMLPFFRKIYSATDPGLQNVHTAVSFYRTSHSLYSRLQLEEKPDPWDVYINAGDLNLSFILEDFQPEKQLFGSNYLFPGYPFPIVRESGPKKFIYVAMGTILNKDIEFYRMCIDVLKEIDLPCILSVGTKVDIAELGPVPEHIKILPFADQRGILKEALLFISRGGMASVHESIHTSTPMIVIPVIPEQQITAERVRELGIGVVLPAQKLSVQLLRTAILDILSSRADYVKNIQLLLKDKSALSAPVKARDAIDGFFRNRPPAGDTIVDLFIYQAGKTPEAIAVRSQQEQLSYGQLHEKAKRIAQLLRNSGIGENDPVAVIIDPCPDIVVAIMGILRAGACYIPIDPEYPAERIDYILKDSNCKIILGNTASLLKCGLKEATDVILIDKAGLQTAAPPSPADVLLPGASDLAYIIYTSGSTGRPKGVMVEHRQIYRYLVDVHEKLELASCNSYAIWGTFSADAGLTALFSALCFGKTLHILNIKSFTDFSDLTLYFKTFPIDCYKITPSLLSLLLQNKEGRRLLPAKRLILGGEACPRLLADQLSRIKPQNCKLYNHYGPTETTVGVTTYPFPERIKDWPVPIPLGKPLPGVRAHILNRELYIEGGLIARGYLNNPELTCEKFVHLNVAGKQTRLYRTGDLVRNLPDGNLEYLGRMDDQVKIHGNRIELKEVETAILSSALVKRCLVLAKENQQGVSYLVAYLQPEGPFEKNALLKFIRGKLPSFMIPGTWISLDEWPLTINNKTDRQALPDPETEDGVEMGALFPPDGKLEDILTGIWMKLLGVKQLTAEADFFELGGDSLKLLQLSFELFNRLQVRISFAELFDYTTIEKLASRLSQNYQVEDREEQIITGSFNDREATLAQRNLYIQNRLHPHDAFPNASLTFKLSGELDTTLLEQALTTTIRKHESLRTHYSFQSGKLYSQIAAEADFKIQYIQCKSDEIDTEICNAVKSFDFGAAPLIRVILFELDTEKYLHVYMPHINSDGESLKIILEDMEALYNGSSMVKKGPQFSDFLKNNHAYLHSAHYSADEAFWKEQIAGDMPLLNFNFSRPPQKAGTGKFDGNFVVSPFPESLTEALRGYIKGKKSTLFQTLFISFALLLHKLTAADDIGILLPVHGRNKNGFENIVGLLSNVILIRFRFDPDQSMSEFINAATKTLLDAFRHQSYPFEMLHQLWKQRGRKLNSLMQAFFGYHHHRSDYQLGDAVLKLHIPKSDKENLPISAAVFDTGSAITLRISSTAGGFTPTELRGLAELYFDMLYQLTAAAIVN